ncbi:MAG: glycosyltransferase family 39 protein [Planctomycetes bacterium]|nr:glycosyltransferase family 39 protein [Planctomycetota bacterium]
MTESPVDPRPSSVPLTVQLVAWVVALGACVLGMLDLVAEWAPGLATVQLLVLDLAPIIYMLPRGRPVPPVVDELTAHPLDWFSCLLVGALSFGICWGIGQQIGNAPPAYHDEFSYLFQAQTFLSGRLSFPSHPVHPELFDQMHVLNEGRMACRYFPGTGLWLAPFVAIGNPFLASWVASALATMAIFWTGREIGGRLTGIVAGLAMALSPGIALFGNTLLAHQPTLMSSAFFLLGVSRWGRTRAPRDALLAGTGLSFAMLCRPMTAAAIGLPFGIDVFCWLLWPRRPLMPPATGSAKSRLQYWGTWLGFGLPLVAGWVLMLTYNQAITGDWRKSPYGLYTEIYTPRHVYGFNNVKRGEQHLGPKVVQAYDQWAENLTPSLAAQNVLTRWVSSWLWTFDGIPLFISALILFARLPYLNRRWFLVVAAIVSVHLLHLPYWYVGIMGWHYVFESSQLWCLVLAGATGLLFTDWKRRGLRGMRTWWCVLLATSLAGIYLSPDRLWKGRLQRGVNSLQYPRQKHAELRQWLERQIDHRPALVLLDQEEMAASHLDLVVNTPGLTADLLIGRYRPGVTDPQQIHRDFPDRQVYVANPEQRTIHRIQ